ncbi:charged multivesicular body protein 2b [Lingula anatina]|uniref:Charged multivesicular body protein 2b n=1 Tax=Lingula anatina TaxID=7574 RepID=A0A1S3JKV0_LINAN|nr:charged multivesicular body protein 2b [Lingula anatina]|eukprot:XP_013411003.1 charged multivesicular body protein 2b [Lingula anatina]
MDLFKKKPTVQEQLRQNDRQIRRTQRDLERDRGQLEKQEKQIEIEIKKAAKRGDKQTATILAKQLVQLRKQKTKSFAVGSRIQGVGHQTKMMHSNMKMANAMGSTTKAMQSMNKVMDPQKTMKTMQDFTKESMKMDMSEEMINDTLDEIFDESGDEEEQDAIVTQVLDEIGIEISGKMADAPSAHKGKLGESSKADQDIERQLAALKDL